MIVVDPAFRDGDEPSRKGALRGFAFGKGDAEIESAVRLALCAVARGFATTELSFKEAGAEQLGEGRQAVEEPLAFFFETFLRVHNLHLSQCKIKVDGFLSPLSSKLGDLPARTPLFSREPQPRHPWCELAGFYLVRAQFSRDFEQSDVRLRTLLSR